ncbi:MAG TPA: SpoIIE family protein phosphatase [Phycisphaerae bacterium]|nr:SpoIIE family protein phosphatase [Phycisphaerae bacterium]
MRIVVSEQDEVLKDLNLDAAPISIGSDAAHGVHLPDLRIALEHARLIHSPTGQWMIEAVAPGEPTTVNGRDIDQRCPIHNGDEIGIHGYLLRVAVEGEFDLGKTGKTSLDELARIRDFPLPKYGEARSYENPLTIGLENQLRLARFAQEIAGAADIEALMDATLPFLIESLSARMAWFGVRRHPRGGIEWMEGRSADGGPGPDPPLLPTLEYRCLDRAQAIRLRRLPDRASAVAVPLGARRGRLGMLYAESKLKADRFHAPDLEWLVALSVHVAARLEALLLAEHAPAGTPPASLEARGLLRDIQIRLFPDSQPSWPGYRLAVHHKAGSQRGGDVYDYLTMPNGMAAILVANASGDLLNTLVSVADVRAACRVAGLHGDPPRTLLREIDWLLQGSRGACTLSAVHVVMNPKSGKFEYATAGDIGAVVIGTAGSPRVLTNPNIPRLGLTKSMEFAVTSDRLNPGETLALFTPGCGTACDGSGEALGGKRMVKALRQSAGLPPADQLDELQAELAAYFRDGCQPDDISVLLVRRG